MATKEQLEQFRIKHELFIKQLKIFIFDTCKHQKVKSPKTNIIRNIILKYYLYNIFIDIEACIIFPASVFNDYKIFVKDIASIMNITDIEYMYYSGAQYFYTLLELYLETELNLLVEIKRSQKVGFLDKDKDKEGTLWSLYKIKAPLPGFSLTDEKSLQDDIRYNPFNLDDDNPIINSELDESNETNESSSIKSLDSKDNKSLESDDNKTIKSGQKKTTFWQLTSTPRRIKEDFKYGLTIILNRTNSGELRNFYKFLKIKKKNQTSIQKIINSFNYIKSKNLKLYLALYSILSGIKVDDVPINSTSITNKLLAVFLIKKLGRSIVKQNIDFKNNKQIVFLYYLHTLNCLTSEQLFDVLNHADFFKFIYAIPTSLNSIQPNAINIENVSKVVMFYFKHNIKMQTPLNNYQCLEIAKFYLDLHVNLLPEKYSLLKLYLSDLSYFNKISVDFLKPNFLKLRCFHKPYNRFEDPIKISDNTLIMLSNMLDALNYKISLIDFKNIIPLNYKLRDNVIHFSYRPINFNLYDDIDTVFLIHSLFEIIISFFNSLLKLDCKQPVSVKINIVYIVSFNVAGATKKYNTITILSLDLIEINLKNITSALIKMCKSILFFLDLRISDVSSLTEDNDLEQDTLLLPTRPIDKWSDDSSEKDKTKKAFLEEIYSLDIYYSTPINDELTKAEREMYTNTIANQIFDFVNNESLCINKLDLYKKLNYLESYLYEK